MRLRSFARLLTAAGTVLLAAPTFAQTANLAVKLTLPTDPPPAGTGDARTEGIPVGGVRTFDVEVTNNGLVAVTEFQVDVAIDAALAFDTVTGCDPLTKTQADPFPCKVSIPTGLLSGTSAKFTFDLDGPAAPKTDAGVAAATCPSVPGPAPSYVTTVTISNIKQGTTPLTNSGTSSDTNTTHLRDWADLEVASLDGPPNTSEGQQITYTTTVKNHGPCDAPRVRVTFNYPATLTFVSADVCTNAATLGDDGFCSLGTVIKGASTVFHATFQVNSFPKSIIKAAIPVDVSIASRTRSASAGPPPVTAAPATDDPLQSNTKTLTQSSNTKDTSATVDLSGNDKGCSTGGAGTIAGLLSLLALRFVRRRAS